MATPSSTRVLAKFDHYTANLSSNELLRDGVRVPIQEKPFHVLRLLVEAEGRVVTREQVRMTLWPEDTFVDFDLGVNTAVKKLRQALEDSAEHPRFVETLPKVGYRFVSPVQWAPEPGTKVDSGPSPADPPEILQAVPGQKPKSRWLMVAVVAAVVLVAVLAVAFLYPRPRTAEVPPVSNYTQLTHDGRWKFLVGTDGARIYMRMGILFLPQIAQMSTVGGEPKEVSVPDLKSATLLSVKPDGSELLFITANTGDPPTLFSLPALGGYPRPIGNLHARVANWSPDGKRLAYAWHGDLWVANADGTDARMLASLGDSVFIWTPVWSPDGKHLEFPLQDGSPQTRSIWQISLDGSDLHRILPDWPDWHDGVKWTANGRYLLFQSRGQIWALRREDVYSRFKPKPIQLTFSPMSFSTLLPSRDGKKIFVIGHTDRGELVRYDAKSAEFSPFLGGLSAEFLDFSRDGKWVAYVSFPEGSLWKAKADGTEAVQLTYPPDRAVRPHWSPDGTQIVFAEINPGRLSKVFEVSAQGGTPRPLLPNDAQVQSDPTWSADGSRILFGGRERDPSAELRILDVKTNAISAVPGSKGLCVPRWSPDGRHIVAQSQDEKSLLMFDFQTQKWRELASGMDGFPTFSKDGSFVYVFGPNPPGGVYRIRVSDAQVNKVTDLKNMSTVGYYGRELALTPDDSLLLLRDVGTQDVYALDWAVPN